MDNFTAGMFADANARKEAEENWVEPMDWNDILNNHNRGLDELEAAAAAAEAAAAEAAKEGWWEAYDSEDIWFD